MEKSIERIFSIELKSKANLKNVSLKNGGPENVLLEGTIGILKKAEFADDLILEVIGDKGVLRINLCSEDITKSKTEEAKENE